MCGLTRAEQRARITSPPPAGSATPDAAQEASSLLSCKKKPLLVHVQLVSHHNPQIVFHKAALQPISPQSVLVCGVIPPQVQDFSCCFVELHVVLVMSAHFSARQGPSGLQHTYQVYQPLLPVLCHHKLAEGVLCPIIQVINEEVVWYWPQCTSSDWPLAGRCLIDDNPLNPAVQPVFSPPYCSLLVCNSTVF